MRDRVFTTLLRVIERRGKPLNQEVRRNPRVSGPGRPALDMPDGLRKKTECEGAQDPFFGVMESHQLPSPWKIQQQHTAAKVDGDYTHTKSPG